MEIWLKQGSKRFRVPVLPSSYQVSSSQNNTSVDVSGLGEINLLGKSALTTITFTSFFPSRYQSFCDSRPKRPKEYIRLLDKMRKNGPMKLHITGVFSLNVTIETLDYEENDGTGDITYTLSLKEYRYLNIPSSTITQTIIDAPVPMAGSLARDNPPKESGKSHVVVAGENLTSIARKETGSTNWRPIYEANKNKIGGNPNLIKVGQVLTIP